MSNNNSRRQANINAKKFDQLMKDIEKDVGRRTINTKKLDVALDKLGIYINNNPFTIGGVKHAEITKLLENIMGQAKFKGLSRGGTAELVKGVISENTMHYVTRMGNDMKDNLRKIAVESYNNKLAPQDIAKKLQKEVQGLSKTRAKSIARTETMRANNLSNLVNAKLNMGAKSYKVISASDCCERCDRIYKNGKVWFDIDDLTFFPPLHTNCRCVVVFSTRTAAENNGLSDADETLNKENKTKDGYSKLGIDDETAKNIEKGIAPNTNKSFENSVGFDKKGNVIERKSGNQHNVSYSENEGIHSHNHTLDDRTLSATPSSEDVRQIGKASTNGILDVKYELIVQGNERTLIKFDPRKYQKYKVSQESQGLRARMPENIYSEKYTELVEEYYKQKNMSGPQYYKNFKSTWFNEVNKLTKDMGLEIVNWNVKSIVF